MDGLAGLEVGEAGALWYAIDALRTSRTTWQRGAMAFNSCSTDRSPEDVPCKEVDCDACATGSHSNGLECPLGLLSHPSSYRSILGLSGIHQGHDSSSAHNAQSSASFECSTSRPFTNFISSPSSSSHSPRTSFVDRTPFPCHFATCHSSRDYASSTSPLSSFVKLHSPCFTAWSPNWPHPFSIAHHTRFGRVSRTADACLPMMEGVCRLCPR